MDFNCFAWSFRNASWTFFSLVATILGTTIFPWSFTGRYSHLCGVCLEIWHTRGHFHFLQTWEVFIARVEVFLPSSYTKMGPYSPRDSGAPLPSFFFNYFIIRCSKSENKTWAWAHGLAHGLPYFDDFIISQFYRHAFFKLFVLYSYQWKCSARRQLDLFWKHIVGSASLKLSSL